MLHVLGEQDRATRVSNGIDDKCVPHLKLMLGSDKPLYQPGQTIQEAIAAAGGSQEPNLLGLRPQSDSTIPDPMPQKI